MLTLTAVVPGILSAIINDFDRPDKEDEDEDFEEYAKNMATEIIDSVIEVRFPIFGRGVLSTLTGQPEGAIPVIRSAKSIPRGITGFRQKLQGVELTPRHVRDLNNAITLATGLPVLSLMSIPYKITELAETPRERKIRLRRRRRQLRTVRKRKKAER